MYTEKQTQNDLGNSFSLNRYSKCRCEMVSNIPHRSSWLMHQFGVSEAAVKIPSNVNDSQAEKLTCNSHYTHISELALEGSTSVWQRRFLTDCLPADVNSEQ